MQAATQARRPTVLRRIKTVLSKVDVADTLNHHPYLALGIAVAVGVGFGAFVGSRLVRTLVVNVGMSVVGGALIEQIKRQLLELDELEKQESQTTH